MIPANGAPHDPEARDVHRSLSFAQRRAHLLEKLNATDRTHAVTIALSRGIIEL